MLERRLQAPRIGTLKLIQGEDATSTIVDGYLVILSLRFLSKIHIRYETLLLRCALLNRISSCWSRGSLLNTGHVHEIRRCAWCGPPDVVFAQETYLIVVSLEMSRLSLALHNFECHTSTEVLPQTTQRRHTRFISCSSVPGQPFERQRIDESSFMDFSCGRSIASRNSELST